MGGRYLVSGAQLGTLITLIDSNPIKADKLINKIVSEQFVFESDDEVIEDVMVIEDVIRLERGGS